MKISIITLFPKMTSSFFEESIIKKAKEKGKVSIEIVDLRDFAIDKRGTVDDRPYGGGAGMVLRVDVVKKAIDTVIASEPHSVEEAKQSVKREIASSSDIRRSPRNDKGKIVLTSAKGKVFNQEKAKEYSKLKHLILIAGHYEGVDERISNFVSEEISLGDFVLTGGEIVVAAIVDSVVRLIPGVLKKEEAPREESFFNVSIYRLIETVGEQEVLKKLKKKKVKTVKLLEYPHYTRPEKFMGKTVPAVLLSGDHKEIEKWRLKNAFEETLKKRPGLLTNK